MAGHQPFKNLIDKMPPDRRARSDQRVAEVRRSHPIWTPITRADWLVMLYGAVSGMVYIILYDDVPAIFGAVFGFFFMVVLVGFSKIPDGWGFIRPPLAVTWALRLIIVAGIAHTLTAISSGWPYVVILSWLLIPLIYLFWRQSAASLAPNP